MTVRIGDYGQERARLEGLIGYTSGVYLLWLVVDEGSKGWHAGRVLVQ